MEPSVVRTIVAGLPPFILAVGVFVNEDVSVVRAVVDECGLALAQLHGDETAEYCARLGRPVLKALRVQDRGAVLTLTDFQARTHVRGFLIDAFSEQAYGGTGHTVDWGLAAEAARTATILLAGGLTPGNVSGAIRQVGPYGVDVSSGVEAQPGKKDPAKVKAFIDAARLVSM